MNENEFYVLGFITDGHSYNQNAQTFMRTKPTIVEQQSSVVSESICIEDSHGPYPYGLTTSSEEITIKLHPDTLLFFQGYAQQELAGFKRKLTFSCTDQCLVKRYFTNTTGAKEYLSIFDKQIPSALFYSQFTKQYKVGNSSNSDSLIYSEISESGTVLNQINYQTGTETYTESRN